MIASKCKASLLALTIAGLLGGCSLEGDDGQDGATGAQGPQGEAGADGTDGQNALQGIRLSMIGRASLDAEGAAEIVQYDVDTNTIYVTNSDANTVEMVSTADLTAESIF